MLDEYLNRMEQLLGRVDTKTSATNAMLGNIGTRLDEIMESLVGAHKKLDRLLDEPDPQPGDYDVILSPGDSLVTAIMQHKRIGLRPGVYEGGLQRHHWLPRVSIEGISGNVVLRPRVDEFGLQFAGDNCRDIKVSNVRIDCVNMPERENNTAIKVTKHVDVSAKNITLNNVSVVNLNTPRSVALLVDSDATVNVHGGRLQADAYGIYCASGNCQFNGVACVTNHNIGDGRPHWGIHIHREDGDMRNVHVFNCDCWDSQGIMVWQGAKGGSIGNLKALEIRFGSNSRDWVASKNMVKTITSHGPNKPILSTTPGVLDDNTYV